jgi:DNA replication protein DnaC
LLKALQNGYRALIIKAQDLFDDLYASLADRSSRKLIDRLARVPLLCIGRAMLLKPAGRWPRRG